MLLSTIAYRLRVYIIIIIIVCLAVALITCMDICYSLTVCGIVTMTRMTLTSSLFIVVLCLPMFVIVAHCYLRTQVWFWFCYHAIVPAVYCRHLLIEQSSPTLHCYNRVYYNGVCFANQKRVDFTRRNLCQCELCAYTVHVK